MAGVHQVLQLCSRVSVLHEKTWKSLGQDFWGESLKVGINLELSLILDILGKPLRLAVYKTKWLSPPSSSLRRQGVENSVLYASQPLRIQWES